MTEPIRLPELPDGQRNFAGFAEYEAILARECPYIGEPCIRERCKKWTTVIVHVPNKLAPTQIEAFNLNQCQDDGNYQATIQVANMIAQQIMGAQMAQMQKVVQQRFVKSQQDKGHKAGPMPFGLPSG
jgi:hypothetical protein